MFENEFYIAQLVAAQINGTITDAQQTELDAWVNASERNTLQYRNYLDERELDEKIKTYYKPDSAAIYQKISEGIKTANPVESAQVVVKLWPRIAVAAAVVLMVFAGVWFLKGGASGGSDQEIRYAGDAVPGKEGATLTLANGKKIRLTTAANGELAKEAGVSISKTADGQLVYVIESNVENNSVNTLSTANAETYQVKLPDGSRIWLNAASSLSYRASLNENGVRKVKLTGEAYLEIEKDAEHPFIVESAGQEVKVLGTHFNVKAYPDEKNIRTTLLEGSVNVSPSNIGGQPSLTEQPSYILKPGEQAVNNGSIIIEKADLQEAMAWKNGSTIFKDKPLQDIMRELSRWYDVTVVYAADAPKNVTFSGAVSRNRNISTVLERMQTTGSVKFEIQGKTVKVMK